MLRQRSFRSAKCKTALTLAISRIKLLKNKKEAYVKQLRMESARLLQAGNDHTATIRAEHVVREEKTIAAYDFIEIYCELIAARLPVIESQKKCPIDLKEAISSVIFASPRCSDIPELMDVQKHIIAKYGKEFVSSAAELRPDSGVNCLLVEKLSAKAPDGPTKIKILTAIAEEHGVKWQPKQFGEDNAQSSQDLVAGPNALEKATYVEPPQVYVPNVQDEKGPPNLHAFYKFREIHDIPTHSHEHRASVATTKAGGDLSKTSGRSKPEIRSSGTGSQKVDFRDSYGENKQNWNMEFKDAASAAKAAAESAEHASMAARAAVQLSNREKLSRRYSSGPHSSYGSESRSEVPQEYAFHAVRSSFGKHNEQINVREHDYQSSAFGNDNPFTYSSQMADDTNPHNNLFKQENTDFLHEMSTKKKESRSEVDFVSEMHADIMTKNNDHIGDARSRTNRQFGKASSSHFVIPSDDYNDYTFVVDKEYNRQESGLFFSSPPSNTNSFSPRQAIDRKESSSSSQSLFTAVSETLPKSAVSFGKEDSFPDIFYDSDGPNFDSDEDYVKSVSGNFGYGNSVIDQSENDAASGTSPSRSDERVVYHRKSRISTSSISSDIMEEDFKRKVSIKNLSGYNRPPYTKSKSLELKHKTFQNEQSSSRVSYQRINRSDNWASSELGTEQHAAYQKNSEPNNRFSRVQSSSSVPKTMIPDSDEVASKFAPKSSKFDGVLPSQERPRPSHVHPKLPDYESLTTYFLSLKKGPQ